MKGLKVKNGRLINERPDGMSGISYAAKLRKENNSRSMTQNIADGIELAKNRSEAKKRFK